MIFQMINIGLIYNTSVLIIYLMTKELNCHFLLVWPNHDMQFS